MWKKIALLMEKQGLNVRQLAKETSIPATTLYTWKAAPDKPIAKVESLQILADFFGVSITDLM